jgi:hypothetical protein
MLCERISREQFDVQRKTVYEANSRAEDHFEKSMIGERCDAGLKIVNGNVIRLFMSARVAELVGDCLVVVGLGGVEWRDGVAAYQVWIGTPE